MAIEAILFDLDGTLLPMDQDEFTRGYFKLLSKKLAPHGYEPKALIDAVWSGTQAMVKNDGSASNETVFWKNFSKIFGEKALQDYPLFEAFYEQDFDKIGSLCRINPQAAETVRKIRQTGYRTALATNPIFPAVATKCRIRWTGLEPEDFEFFTSYENTGYCKPNPAYYRDLLDRLHTEASKCLMVGNDVSEDMVAQNVGMQVFLLTDCLINREQKDISLYPHGSFEQLLAFVEQQSS